MSLADAAAYAQLLDTRDRVAGDSSRSFYQRASELGPVGMGLSGAYGASQPSQPSTFGSILRMAIGGALGYGLGRGIGAAVGLPESRTNALAAAGAAYGGLVGLSKSASDTTERREAFRAGFIKAAVERGYFKKHAFIAPLLLAPLTGLSGVAQQAGTAAGSVLGAADAPDDVDTAIVREKVETELLRQELERVKAQRKSRILKQLLAKRTAAVK